MLSTAYWYGGINERVRHIIVFAINFDHNVVCDLGHCKIIRLSKNEGFRLPAVFRRIRILVLAEGYGIAVRFVDPVLPHFTLDIEGIFLVKGFIGRTICK